MTCPFQLRSQLLLRLLGKMSQDFLTTMSYPNVGSRTKWWLQLPNASNFQFLRTANSQGQQFKNWRILEAWTRDTAQAVPHPATGCLCSYTTLSGRGKFGMNTSSSALLQFNHVRDEAQKIQKEGQYFITCLTQSNPDSPQHDNASLSLSAHSCSLPRTGFLG